MGNSNTEILRVSSFFILGLFILGLTSSVLASSLGVYKVLTPQKTEYRDYSVKEIELTKSTFQNIDKLFFFRQSTQGRLKQSRVYVFKEEDLQIYNGKLKVENTNQGLFLRKTATLEEIHGLTVEDQVTGEQIPLLDDMETCAHYTGSYLNDNYCPGNELDPNTIYHLFDCQSWGCRIEAIK